jgi:DNA processing protein
MSWRKSTDPDCSAELRALLLLRMLPAYYDKHMSDLLAQHSPETLLTRPNLLGRHAHALTTPQVQDRCRNAFRAMQRLEVCALTIHDPEYPPRLKRLGAEAPAMLFARGNTELLNTAMVAVIGARNSTEYGDSVGHQLAGDLARRGVTIVSGLALGIDGVAHRAALAEGGNTIAVLGCGIDVNYPPSHARLQERIAHDGLLLSEFAPGTPAMRHQFPKRNQIIATLPEGVLVIEAGPRSGTRKTVDRALTSQTEVFAVPGPIGRYESQGTNEIIQQGAHLVTQVRDIIEGLHWLEVPAEEEAVSDVAENALLSEPARAVFSKLDATARHVDAIARACSLATTDALVLLTELELDGYIVQHSGKRFSRPPVVK